MSSSREGRILRRLSTTKGEVGSAYVEEHRGRRLPLKNLSLLSGHEDWFS